jgi:hypothetical protein
LNNLSHIESRDSKNFAVFVSGRVTVSFFYTPIDAENINEPAILNQFHNSAAAISSRVLLRFTERQRQVFSDDKNSSRSDDFKKIGRVEAERILTFETWTSSSRIEDLNPFSKSMKGDLTAPIGLLQATIDNLNLSSFGIELTPLTEEETNNFISWPEEVYKFENHISLKNNPNDKEHQSRVMLFGCVRLKNLNKSISLKSIAHLKSILPKPFTLSVTFKKPVKMWSEFKMRAQAKSTEMSGDVSTQLKNQELTGHIDRMTQGNEVPFEVEFLIGIERISEEQLQKDLNAIAKHLEWIGSPFIETYGTFVSYKAMQVSEYQHLIFEELSLGTLFLMPIFSYFSSDSQKIDKKSLARVHRKSDELDGFNLFHKNTSGNTLVIGSTGRGKSFFVNLLSESILQDPKIRLMIVDVGSSYVRACQRYNGKHFTIALDRPSGLNPFLPLKLYPHSLEICLILTSFVETLLLETSETCLSKDLQIELSNELVRYSESRPENPSLVDFYHFVNLARKRFLSQWVDDGIYNNIFKEDESCDDDNRFKYFDFQSIHLAKNNDLMQATVGAVMADYNIRMFVNGKFGDKVVLICDETKFVFEKCAPFFHVTCANARKLGNGLVLINQESIAFDTKDGSGEKTGSLFNNSSNHFLFIKETTESKSDFMKHHKLTEENYKAIDSLVLKKGIYSEVFLKSDTGGRTLRIRPSQDEYWRWTTDDDERKYIHHLTEEFKLTEEEVIACLIMQREKQSGSSLFVT